MAQRNGPSVLIHLGSIDIQELEVGDCCDRKRFIDFDRIDLLKTQACTIQCFWDGKGRGRSKLSRVGRCIGPASQVGERRC